MKLTSLLLLITVLLLISGCASESTATIGEKTFSIEIADTEPQRNRGLMFRTELCENCGMIFTWEKPGGYTFWMKNTLIPLDMLFIGEDMVVHTLHHATPCKSDPCPTYAPKDYTKYVLEVNNGTFDESVIGQKIELTLP